MTRTLCLRCLITGPIWIWDTRCRLIRGRRARCSLISYRCSSTMRKIRVWITRWRLLSCRRRRYRIRSCRTRWLRSRCTRLLMTALKRRINLTMASRLLSQTGSKTPSLWRLWTTSSSKARPLNSKWSHSSLRVGWWTCSSCLRQLQTLRTRYSISRWILWTSAAPNPISTTNQTRTTTQTSNHQ